LIPREGYFYHVTFLMAQTTRKTLLLTCSHIELLGYSKTYVTVTQRYSYKPRKLDTKFSNCCNITRFYLQYDILVHTDLQLDGLSMFVLQYMYIIIPNPV